MRKLTFLAGAAAGYVFGTRAGQRRYAQIKSVSGKVWHSGPVQKQVDSAKEAARTRAAPAVADAVAGAAKGTARRLRASRTVPGRAVSPMAGSPTNPTTTDPSVDATRPWNGAASTDRPGGDTAG